MSEIDLELLERPLLSDEVIVIPNWVVTRDSHGLKYAWHDGTAHPSCKVANHEQAIGRIQRPGSNQKQTVGYV